MMWHKGRCCDMGSLCEEYCLPHNTPGANEANKQVVCQMTLSIMLAAQLCTAVPQRLCITSVRRRYAQPT